MGVLKEGTRSLDYGSYIDAYRCVRKYVCRYICVLVLFCGCISRREA